LKVGVVGLGKMGLLHASILSIMPAVQVVALCDKSWIMRKLAKNTLKKTLVTDKLDEMTNLHLDVLYVTIPSQYRIVKEIYEKVSLLMGLLKRLCLQQMANLKSYAGYRMA
jgi:threonine dehydrogenase-like Zn-dependent dehydrogenase